MNGEQWAEVDLAEIAAQQRAYVAEYGPEVEAEGRVIALCEAADAIRHATIRLKEHGARDASIATDAALAAVVRELTVDERTFRAVYEGIVYVGLAAGYAVEQARGGARLSHTSEQTFQDLMAEGRRIDQALTDAITGLRAVTAQRYEQAGRIVREYLDDEVSAQRYEEAAARLRTNGGAR